MLKHKGLANAIRTMMERPLYVGGQASKGENKIIHMRNFVGENTIFVTK